MQTVNLSVVTNEFERFPLNINIIHVYVSNTFYK